MSDADANGPFDQAAPKAGNMSSGPSTEDERFEAIREVWQSEVGPVAELLAEPVGTASPPGMSSRDAAMHAAEAIERAIEQLQRPSWYLRGLGAFLPPEGRQSASERAIDELLNEYDASARVERVTGGMWIAELRLTVTNPSAAPSRSVTFFTTGGNSVDEVMGAVYDDACRWLSGDGNEAMPVPDWLLGADDADDLAG